MAWLDRDQKPVRFTLVTSVASGLVVSVILKAFSGGIADGVVLMWFTLAAGGAAAVAFVARSVFLGARKRSARVFLMTSAFSQKYYVAALVQRLHSLLDRDGIDLVLKVPDRDYDASAQSHHLRRLLDRRHDYIGGIIVAAEVHRLRDDLIAFCRNSRLPVVFTDIEPFDTEDQYPKNTAYIGFDTGELGDLGGRWLAKTLQGTERPNVLIIASREHNARQQRCEQALRAALPDVNITINDGCAFIRSRAHDAVRAHIRRLAPGQRLDAIFCTNDEMALGAVDALSSLPDHASQDTIVVGIDGVQETRALIDNAQSPLRATVVQDADRLASGVVDLLEKMHRNRLVAKRTILSAEIHEVT
ncbi:MAG TPA: sugar ABC transporter substrate-binding protein [Streptosporangiaceae bacterium]|nr:sugar ABC transporter substrate-binding protein [Streptosporangiaceae bacterium]